MSSAHFEQDNLYPSPSIEMAMPLLLELRGNGNPLILNATMPATSPVFAGEKIFIAPEPKSVFDKGSGDGSWIIEIGEDGEQKVHLSTTGSMKKLSVKPEFHIGQLPTGPKATHAQEHDLLTMLNELSTLSYPHLVARREAEAAKKHNSLPRKLGRALLHHTRPHAVSPTDKLAV